MPRANVTPRFNEERELRDELIAGSQASLIAQDIRTFATDHRGVLTPRDLSALLHVPARQLVAHLAPTARKMADVRIDEDGALEALRRYLPKVLGWRTLVDFGKEIGEDRNTVESLVTQYGEPGMILVAPDNKMYISAQGEGLVRKRKESVAAFSTYARLTDVAKSLGISNGVALNFFTARKIPVHRDIHGRIRLSGEHVQDLIRWRTLVTAWRGGEDVTIDGKSYRPIAVLAREKADLLEPHGTPSHEARVRREDGTLRHFCHSVERSRSSNKLGQYVTSEIAQTFLRTISLIESARLFDVSTSTIKHWRRNQKSLRPAGIPGKKTQGLDLPRLLTFTREKYEQETKLNRKPTRPAALVALPLQAVALKAGVEYAALVDLLRVPKAAREVMLAKRGVIPRTSYEQLQKDLSRGGDIEKAAGSFIGAVQYLLEVFKPSSPIASPTAVQSAVERAALRRGVSAHQVYAGALALFPLQDLWPQTYQELQTKHEFPFPLAILCYLNALADPKRNLFVHNQIPEGAEIKEGDIFVHPESSDFGLVTKINAGLTAPSIEVTMACKNVTVRFTPSALAR